MTEHQPNKARRTLEQLYEGVASRVPVPTPERPKLELRVDMPAIEAGEMTRVTDALHELDAEGVDTVAIRGTAGEPKAVVVSVERYLDLVAPEVERAPGVVTNGQIWMTDEDLKASHVQQADPTQPWGILPPQIR